MRGAIVILAVVLAFSGQVQAAEPPAAAPKPECTCAAAFDQVVAGIEESYAGFRIKVDADRRESYDRFKALLKADAAGAGPDRCKEVLDTYAAFLQDHHVFVLRNSKAGGPAGKTVRAWTEAEVRAEIDKNRGDHTYYLGIPLYARTRHLPAGALDVVGITPDVPVPDSLADPLAFAVRLLAVREP